MDWLSALCLSVPPSLALVFVVHEIVAEFRVFRESPCGPVDTIAHALFQQGRRNRQRSRAAERFSRKTALLVAEIEAEAAVKCARYGAKVIRGKPPKEPARKPTAHEVWLGTEGKALPESVRDRVEWAVLRLRGEESDEQGDEDDAEAILDQFAPGLAGATRDEVKRALGAKG